MTRLIVGTAQFGLGYGITNNFKRLDDETVAEILTTAVAGGVNTFDTAEAYGDAQERLGRLMPLGADVQYISKFTLDCDPTTASLYSDAASRLRVDTIAGLLVHRVGDLLDERFPAALKIIRAARRDGAIERFGVSVYDLDDLELALATMPDLSLIQIPGSIIDRRLLDSPVVTELRSGGVEVHVRSAFLQGLLLAVPNRLAAPFEQLRPILEDLDAWAAAAETSRLAVVLGYLASHDNADAVVVGAAKGVELRAVLEAWTNPSTDVPMPVAGALPLHIIDPRLWQRS